MIYFPHDAPEVVATTLEETAAWARSGEFRVALVGPDGEREKMGDWLRKHNVLAARATVCYNHLAVRAAIDEAMGNANATVAPDFATVAAQLDGLEESLLANARHISSKEALDIEAGQQAQADDVARVRDPDESIARVALLSSSSTTDDVMRSAVSAAQRAPEV